MLEILINEQGKFISKETKKEVDVRQLGLPTVALRFQPSSGSVNSAREDLLDYLKGDLKNTAWELRQLPVPKADAVWIGDSRETDYSIIRGVGGTVYAFPIIFYQYTPKIQNEIIWDRLCL